MTNDWRLPVQPTLMDILRVLEWDGSGDAGKCTLCDRWVDQCPICKQCKDCGHAEDCYLKAALDAGGEP